MHHSPAQVGLRGKDFVQNQTALERVSRLMQTLQLLERTQL